MRLKKEFAYYAKIALNRLGWIAGQVELTTKCFQRCRGCMSWQQPHKEFTLDQLKIACQQLVSFPTFEHLTLTGGDPQAWSSLNEFFRWYIAVKPQFKLQINCAMTQPIKNRWLWREALSDIKVSMDSCNEKIYQLIRGDKKTTPQMIMDRCWKLDHPRLAFNVTVYPENQIGLVDLIYNLNWHHQQGLSIRKVMITAGIGSEARKGNQDKNFWDIWQKHKKIILSDKNIAINTSFHELHDEDELMVRDICSLQGIKSVHCWSSLLGFHAKPNGDLYPCCIVGGEVAETLEEFKVGNIFESNLKELYPTLTSQLHYKKEVCRDNCMYKQLQLNLITEQASEVILSLP